MRAHEIIRQKSLAGDQGDVIEYKGGHIDIHTAPQYAPRRQSVIEFLVPEESRNQGIGDRLVKMALAKYNDLGAQVSSQSSLKVFHNNGFRNPNLPNGSIEDHRAAFDENGGSLFLAHKDKSGQEYTNATRK